MRNPFSTHSRSHERICGDPVRAPAKDANIIYFEEPSESGLVNQLVLDYAHAAKPNPLDFSIQQLALLR